MSKTLALRGIINERLNPLLTSYYRNAKDTAQYPYCVYDLDSVNFTDERDDYELIIDIFDKGFNTKIIDEKADSIESAFKNVNLPNSDVLPTIFREMRTYVKEDDKNILHIQLRFLIESYEI